MATSRQIGLSELASYGFSEFDKALQNLEELVRVAGDKSRPALAFVSKSQDPDQSLELLIRLARSHPGPLKPVLAKPDAFERLCRVLGSSTALFDFINRNPKELGLFAEQPKLPTMSDHSMALKDSDSVVSLRSRYRRQLLAIADYDLSLKEPITEVGSVSASLADLAGVTIDAALVLARKEFSEANHPYNFEDQEIAATSLAVIGMGKCGARELNYISDVDVIYVARSTSDQVETTRVLEIATKLATRMMRIMDEPGVEPPLWQVDANLRPEGKSGALVRTIESHLSYYERWAESWEFQALLKARPIAGDAALGEEYIQRIWPKVWESAARENFVDSVQRMRQRVTENIPSAELDAQIKLGPGGLRDVEFTVQLLQLVHGRTDDSIRVRDTLGALAALSAGGYIGREDGERFASHYRFLRFLEHRIQLISLRRTHLMPADETSRRSIARAVSLVMTSDQLIQRWEKVKLEVRSLHQQLFYRPLLSAVSGLSEVDLELSSDQAQARLSAIGFQDTRGALAHISALTTGLSRRAAIQRQLLPVLLQWFAEGTDPDAALLAFRRLSEDLGDSHWYLRMLRDSSGAAKRMTQVFSTSRLATGLFERIPEAAAWFDREEDMKPQTMEDLMTEFEAIIIRHEDTDAAINSIRAIRRRETLRIAIGAALGLTTLEEISQGLTDLTEGYLRAVFELAKKSLSLVNASQQLAIVAMGRFGGGELGFGSDADVMFVYKTVGDNPVLAQTEAEKLVSEIRRLSQDQILEFELDLDLRPEGKNGPIVRSIDSYAAYYKRWAGTWESQALLRARVIAGEEEITDEFIELIDSYRYPAKMEESAIVEIRRIKARVEVERLPQGADPKRHLKLGRGSISDVEWLVQLFQLRFAREKTSIQTPKTLVALDEMEKIGLISSADCRVLREAWLISSRVRSAAVLYLNKRTDVLPADRKQLEGIARLMEYPRGGASSLEEDYLAATRRGRMVFERLFFD